MSNWSDIWNKAEQAKQAHKVSTTEGERQFDALLRVNPNDGMIYLQRAQAREAVGATTEASEDYQQALTLMPRPSWKDTARKGLERCRSANLREQPPVVPTSSVLDRYDLPRHVKEAWLKSLSNTGLDPQQCIQAGRVALEETLQWLNPEPVSSDTLQLQIEAFSKIGTSRKATITHMHTMRILGNQASHSEGSELNERDRAAFQEAAKAMLGDIARKPA